MSNESESDDFDVFDVPSSSPDFRTELAEQLAALVPEAVADGKIDVTKLQELLADDVADDSERFGLFWPGKKRALRAAQEPTTATLRPDLENSKDWDTTQNVFIEGDNLEVLKIMQKHYHGKIKLIYIDPPYNTGKDFVYPDNYKEGLDSYLEWTRQVNEEGKKLSTNSETEGRYHSNWLNMMYPRLKLARNLLTDDGVIVVHIDEHEYANLEKVLAEIFGEGNNLGTIIWDKRNPKGDSRGVAQQHELISLVCKNRERFSSSNGLKRPKPNAQRILHKAEELAIKHSGVNEQSESEFREWIRAQALSGGEAAYCHIDKDGEVYSSVSMAWPNKKKAPADYFVPLIHPVTGNACPVPERGWRNPSSTMSDLLANNLILFGKDESTQPRRKYLLRENLHENVPSLLYYGASDDALLSGMGIPFDNPKPVDLVASLMNSLTHMDSMVLDFFAGSSTTAHAVQKLNSQDGGARKFVMVQLPEPTPDGSEAQGKGFMSIAEISRARIAAANLELLTGSKGDGSSQQAFDGGFRSFRLTDSSFSKWSSQSETDGSKLSEHLLELRETANDDATQDDLLFEILLKQGYSLTEQVEALAVSGLEMRSVAGGVLLAYLNEHEKPSLDQLRAVVAEAPARLIVLEDAFHGDDELKTNLAQVCKSNGIELWTA